MNLKKTGAFVVKGAFGLPAVVVNDDGLDDGPFFPADFADLRRYEKLPFFRRRVSGSK